MRSGFTEMLRGLLDRPLASYYLLLSSAGLLLTIGLVMVFSATMVESYEATGNAFAVILQQVIWAVVGLVCFWIAQRLPARTYRAVSRPLLVVAILLGLFLVVMSIKQKQDEASGDASGGIATDQLWIHIGNVQFQPAEIAKFALLLWAADSLVRLGPRIASWRDLAIPMFPIAGLLMIIIGYADLGTMLIILAMFVGLLWASGVPLRILGVLFAIAMVGSALLIAFEGYRMERIISFSRPEDFADTWGYQAIQGYYAIADGGWFGLGLGESRQKWEWLPNGHNDFIFALIAEELGVVGCLVILALFGVLVYTGFRIARRSDDAFRSLVAAGVTIWIAGQAFINIGGVLGLIPMTGVPLPFISDGGTALVVVLAAVGMLAGFARAEPDAAQALRARNPSRLVRLLWAPLPPAPRSESDSETTKKSPTTRKK
ncbi:MULTISPECIES: FtsW/RodA/SpoVE family cell cycle protein [Glycomyces]|uniref:Probable peptidoglycan glycosyltransferase FtsW n=2 Tax=Glycomyces artemisiae TaxID=1076443 RepID=A0A2T0UW67_9ACTN|nr:putative peptidoglycan glycosyltransferase FtsW [Glycomyces artemisiae]PRY62189.1 cell division-specific peptidoglycan biosynthesis regulator FtsW [Glycomyces artemisiae]